MCNDLFEINLNKQGSNKANEEYGLKFNYHALYLLILDVQFSELFNFLGIGKNTVKLIKTFFLKQIYI